LANDEKKIPVFPVFNSVDKKYPTPTDPQKFSYYILSGMERCQKLAQIKGKKKPQQLGRANGDWFEFFIEKIFLKTMNKEDFVLTGRSKHKINELRGFEKVNWVPMPDIVVKNFQDVRGIVSVKWGMRQDRMYQSAYEAASIKKWIAENNLQPAKVFLFTNDDSSARLKTMLNVPELDGVFHLQPEKFSDNIPEIKSLVDLINELKKL